VVVPCVMPLFGDFFGDNFAIFIVDSGSVGHQVGASHDVGAILESGDLLCDIGTGEVFCS